MRNRYAAEADNAAAGAVCIFMHPPPALLEYSIMWLTCAFGSERGVMLVSLPGTVQDRLRAHVQCAQLWALSLVCTSGRTL
jgi:hypothetical protein